MKTKSLISGLAMLALVIGAQRGVTAAGDSQKKKPPAQDTYTITQLDIGANVASTGQLISDNQVVAGNLQGDSRFAFAWSAQTGFVVLTLGGSSSLASDISANGIVSGAADTPGETEVLGFIWTPANGLVTIGDLGGGYTVPQSVNSSGLVIGDATHGRGARSRVHVDRGRRHRGSRPDGSRRQRRTLRDRGRQPDHWTDFRGNRLAHIRVDQDNRPRGHRHARPRHAAGDT